MGHVVVGSRLMIGVLIDVAVVIPEEGAEADTIAAAVVGVREDSGVVDVARGGTVQVGCAEGAVTKDKTHSIFVFILFFSLSEFI
jgi:uncharacterized membrane protein